MSALSVPLVSCSFEDLMNHEQSVNGREILESNPDESNPPPISDDKKIDKKLNHNASERNRRKKINDMFSSLRSILPTTDSDQKVKKMSFPSTITRALKYIPELQQEVEILNRKKEELKLMDDKCRENENIENGQVTTNKKRNRANECSSGVISVNTFGDEEVLIQLCTDNQYKQKIRLSNILITLEEEGLLLLHLSCFESFGKVFHNLHLQIWEWRRFERSMRPSEKDQQEEKARDVDTKASAKAEEGAREVPRVEEASTEGEGKTQMKKKGKMPILLKDNVNFLNFPNSHGVSSKDAHAHQTGIPGSVSPLPKGQPIIYPQQLNIIPFMLGEDVSSSKSGNVKAIEKVLAEIYSRAFINDEMDNKHISEEVVDISNDAFFPHTSPLFTLPNDVVLATKAGTNTVTTPPKRKRPSTTLQDSEFEEIPSTSENLARARENIESDTLASFSKDGYVMSVAEKLAKSKEDVEARKFAAVEAKKKKNAGKAKAKNEVLSKKARPGTFPLVVENSVKEKGVLDSVIQQEVISKQEMQDVQEKNVQYYETTYNSKDFSSGDISTSRQNGSSNFYSSGGDQITQMSMHRVGEIMERSTVDEIICGSPFSRALTDSILSFPTDFERLPTNFTNMSRQFFAHLEQGAILASRFIDYHAQQIKETEEFEMKNKFVVEVQAEVAKATTSLQAELDEAREETEAARRIRDAMANSKKQLQDYVTKIGGELKEGKERLEKVESEIAHLQRKLEKANAKILEQSEMVEQSNNNSYASGYAVGVSYMRARKFSKAWTTPRFKLEMPFPNAAGGVLEPRSPRRDSDISDDEEYEDAEGDKYEDEAED